MYISDLTNHFSSASVDIRNQKLVLGGISEYRNPLGESIVNSLQESFTKWKDSLPNSSDDLQLKVYISGDGNSLAITSFSILNSTSVSYTSNPKK